MAAGTIVDQPEATTRFTMRNRLDPEQQALVHAVEAFVRAHWQPDSASPAPERDRTAISAALARRGWSAPQWPPDNGGAGLSPGEAFLVDRTLAAAGVPRPDPDTVLRAGGLIRTLGEPAQCARWLPELLRGAAQWVVHAGLREVEPLPVTDRDGVLKGAPGITRVYGAASAHRLLALVRHGETGTLAVAAARLTRDAVAPGAPPDPDELDLPALIFERLGPPRLAHELTDVLARIDADCVRAGICRSAPLRRSLDLIGPAVEADEPLARRRRALEVELMALEALELRAFFPAVDRTGPSPVPLPDERLLAALPIRTAELGTAIMDLVVAALGYHALPAPDPLRQHNELPGLVADGTAAGPDAIGALLRYVFALDTMGGRDRLARLTGAGSHEG